MTSSQPQYTLLCNAGKEPTNSLNSGVNSAAVPSWQPKVRTQQHQSQHSQARYLSLVPTIVHKEPSFILIASANGRPTCSTYSFDPVTQTVDRYFSFSHLHLKSQDPAASRTLLGCQSRLRTVERMGFLMCLLTHLK